jgi:hypothetical protein
MVSLLLSAVSIGAVAAPQMASTPVSNLLTCLGEQVYADLPKKNSERSRQMAYDVLEAVYALPEQQKRFFLEKRRGAMGFAIFPNVQKSGAMGGHHGIQG